MFNSNTWHQTQIKTISEQNQHLIILRVQAIAGSLQNQPRTRWEIFKLQRTKVHCSKDKVW